jgi:hypothetical protein
MFATNSIPTATNGTPPSSSHGSEGLRSAVHGFFKTHTSSGALALFGSGSSIGNEHSDLHLMSNFGGSDVNRARTSSADHLYGVSSSSSSKIHRLSDAEIKMVVSDTESFRKIQQALRNLHAQTDALVKQIGAELIQEQWVDLRRTQQRQEQVKRAEQRKLSIARELTEARIKARQALKLDDVNTPVRKDRSGSMEENGQHHSSTSSSPTSVTAMLDVDDSKIGTFQVNLDEEASEDEDIQEMVE